MSNQITIQFGKTAMDEYRKTGSKLSGFLLEKVMNQMTEQGYSDDAIGRAIFEDALDYATKFKAVAILKGIIDLHKVPKFVHFEISVPKRE